MKSLRKVIFSTLSVALITANFSGVGALANTSNSVDMSGEMYSEVFNQNTTGHELSPEEHEQLIATMEQFLHVEDGQFVFDDIPFIVHAQYGHEIVQSLVDGVEFLNDQAEEGIIQINDDFSIIDDETSPI